MYIYNILIHIYIYTHICIYIYIYISDGSSPAPTEVVLEATVHQPGGPRAEDRALRGPPTPRVNEVVNMSIGYRILNMI